MHFADRLTSRRQSQSSFMYRQCHMSHASTPPTSLSINLKPPAAHNDTSQGNPTHRQFSLQAVAVATVNATYSWVESEAKRVLRYYMREVLNVREKERRQEATPPVACSLPICTSCSPSPPPPPAAKIACASLTPRSCPGVRTAPQRSGAPPRHPSAPPNPSPPRWGSSTRPCS